MLKLLRIDNFALIDHLEIPFSHGLNVLTGETGAGKSIILDALDAALGGSVSSRSIRTGSIKATLEAIFDPKLLPVITVWLEEQEIDLLEEGLVCSREITARSSRSRINGILVNKQQMLQIRSKLVEITAQGQTLQLQDPVTQRRWLDGYGGSDVIQIRQKVQAAYQKWADLKHLLERHHQDQQTRYQRRDILEFQAQELSSLRLENPQELEQLERERDRLAHSVELQKQSYDLYQLLYQAEEEGTAAADLLGQAERLLKGMVELDPDLQSVLEMVNSALIQVEEAGREIYQYAEHLNSDPVRLNKIERRIVQLKQVCRKYGPTLAQVIQHTEKVMAELDQLKDQSSNLEDLEKQLQDLQGILEKASTHLTQVRQKTALRLEKGLTTELQPLGMASVQFKVDLTSGSFSAEGRDGVTFLFSPNLGEPLQPLAETASGGEMSRFLLGIKAVFSQVDPVATMVFDEIDTGVSGKMAQAIATKLCSIATDHQILCVTHQPLIAAMADHHIRVRKVVQKKRTMVQVDPLSTEERRDELAQLAAGHSAQEAIAFVDALLAQAAQLRAQKTQPATS